MLEKLEGAHSFTSRMDSRLSGFVEVVCLDTNQGCGKGKSHIGKETQQHEEYNWMDYS